MDFSPQYRRFSVFARRGGRFPFLIEIPGAPSPRETAERWLQAIASRPLLLLESTRHQGENGRWSWILAEPVRRFTGRGDAAALARFRRSEARNAMPRLEGHPPFLGGFAGLAAYEWKDTLHFGGRKRIGGESNRDLDLACYDRGWVYDHQSGKAWAFMALRVDRINRDSFDRGVAQCEAWLRRSLSFARPVEGTKTVAKQKSVAVAGLPDERILAADAVRRNRFTRMVRSAQKRIRDGWIYQANLSHPIQIKWPLSAWPVYTALARINPSCFGGFADFGDSQLICGSPERLVARRGEVVFTRPIAGTRPKAESILKDRKLRRELLLSDKERAEHVMLVDLERNDLGRVCAAGSVRVDEFMTVEEYSHVRHIVSNLEGRIAPGRDGWDVLVHLFPGGTITGAPKISAMNIIQKLEKSPRGAYTGAIGYHAWTGDCDWNIVIRSASLRRGRLVLRVGAGIVADSNPDREYEETLHKAAAFLKAVRIAAGVSA